jgi:hypothetical protein
MSKRHGRSIGSKAGGVTVEKAVAFQRPPARVFNPRTPRSYGSVKSVVDQVINDAGGPKQVAHRFGISETLVYDYAHPGTEKEISFARIAALTGPDRPAAAEYLAHLAGGVFLPLPRAGDHALGRLTASFARETGEAISVIVASLADGRVTPAEAARDLREVDEAMSVFAALRSELAQLAAAKKA